MNKIDVATLKQQAARRWPELLTNIGGLQSEFLHFDNREGPCPRCGGSTLFAAWMKRQAPLLFTLFQQEEWRRHFGAGMADRQVVFRSARYACRIS